MQYRKSHHISLNHITQCHVMSTKSSHIFWWQVKSCHFTSHHMTTNQPNCIDSKVFPRKPFMNSRYLYWVSFTASWCDFSYLDNERTIVNNTFCAYHSQIALLSMCRMYANSLPMLPSDKLGTDRKTNIQTFIPAMKHFQHSADKWTLVTHWRM